MSGMDLGSESLRLIYITAFVLSAVVCFASIQRAKRIESPEIRRGLIWLLVTAGAWASTHVGYLAAPTTTLAYWFHMAGLVVGFGTVGPWLYFVSAYSGRSLHRNRPLRRAAIGLFGVVVTIKLTNPLHGWYFTTQLATEPFSYLMVGYQPLHWIVMGLAYALAFVGFFMLFELFVQVGSDTRPLFALVGVAGLPIFLDVLSATTEFVLDISYSPLGVAGFAVGILYVYFDRFQIVQLAGESTDPMIVIDDQSIVRDYNAAAVSLFPMLKGSVDKPIETAAPAVAAAIEDPEPIVEIDDAESTSYYRVHVHAIGSDPAQSLRRIVFNDITQSETHRGELERQNARLEQFASVVSHDLRNPLNVVSGRIELARETGDPKHLDAAANALDRMETLIDDILTLAREGRSIGDLERVDLRAVALEAWETIDAGEASLEVHDGLPTLEADRRRLIQLFENLYRNSVEHGSTGSRAPPGDAIEHGGENITVTVGALDDEMGFYIADDGDGIPKDVRSQIFEAGFSTNPDGTGFGLAIIREIVHAHGWTIEAVDAASGGARFEIRTGDRPANPTGRSESATAQ